MTEKNINNVVFVNKILKYVVSDIKSALKISHVNNTWCDTISHYSKLNNINLLDAVKVKSVPLIFNLINNNLCTDIKESLYYISENEDLESLKILCSNNNIDINQKLCHEVFLLHQFSKKDSVESFECFKFLCSLPNINLNVKYFYEDTVLKHAIYYNNVNCVKILLNHKNNLNINDSEWRVLVDVDLNLNYRQCKDKKFYQNKYEILKLFCNKGYNINKIITCYNLNAVMLSVIRGNKEMLEMLCECGADIIVENYYGFTALDLAIINNKKDFFEMLYKKSKGCDVTDDEYKELNYRLKKKACIVEIFEYTQHKQIHRLLKSGTMTDIEILCFVLDKGIYKCAEQLCDIIDINAKDNFGNTALILAAKYRYNEGILKLCCRGADINIANNDGDTSLHYAIKSHSYKCVKTLIAYDANPYIKNNKNYIAVYCALEKPGKKSRSYLRKYMERRKESSYL